MLRVEITTGDNITYFSEYDHIRIASEAKQFRYAADLVSLWLLLLSTKSL